MSRRLPVIATALVAASLQLSISTSATVVHAQSNAELKADADALFASRFEIDEADPASKVPTVAERDATPIDFAYFLMNLSERAEAAEKKGDRAAQIRYLRGIAAAVPDRSVGFSKLCKAFEADRQLAAAEESCGAAVSLPGASYDDFTRYVRVVLGQERELDAMQLENLKAVQAHMQRQAPDSPALLDLDCQLAIRTKDAARFATCRAGLEKLPANDLKRLTYRFAWAIGQHDYAAATSVIEDARSTAQPELVDQMTRARTAALPWWRRALESPSRLASVGAVAMALIALAFVYVRQRRSFGRARF